MTMTESGDCLSLCNSLGNMVSCISAGDAISLCFSYRSTSSFHFLSFSFLFPFCFGAVSSFCSCGGAMSSALIAFNCMVDSIMRCFKQLFS